MTSRRKVLMGIACCPCVAVGFSTSALAKRLTEVGGCTIERKDSQLLRGRAVEIFGKRPGRFQPSEMEHSTGNAEQNIKLDQALQDLASEFNVWPGFGFYDDYDGENALALDYPLVQSTSHTVLFGKRLYRSMLRLDPSGAAVMWTAAHEFGHVWVYQEGLRDRLLTGQPTVKRLELHADFLAGYYLGLKKKRNPQVTLWEAGADIWNSGDSNFTSHQHHGTPAERLAAAESGFRLSYLENRSSHYAFAAATNYVATR